MTALAHSPDIATISGRRRQRSRLGMLILALLLLAAVLCSVGVGAVAIPPDKVLALLVAPLGIDLSIPFDARDEAILHAIRLPRTIIGALSGAGLALAGAALQGLFRNPLADPTLIGVSMGAALAAACTIVLSGPLFFALLGDFGPFLLPTAAFAGGLVSTMVVYVIANREGGTDIPTMLLAGVAINAIAAAGIGMLVFLSDDQQLRDLQFWLLGSLGGVTWSKLIPAVPLLMLGLVALPLLSRHLNAFLLGETDAFHLGFNVERCKRVIIVLAALLTGASVALTGVIGFVGLLVPHLVRLTLGPDHRTLLPASMLLGASLMLFSDLGARTVVQPAELPIGVLTSCLGGPFFLWLLIRRRAFGGW